MTANNSVSIGYIEFQKSYANFNSVITNTDIVIESYNDSILIGIPTIEGIIDSVKIGWDKLRTAFHNLRMKFVNFIKSIVKRIKRFFGKDDIKADDEEGSMNIDEHDTSEKSKSNKKGKIEVEKSNIDPKKAKEFADKAKDVAKRAEELDREIQEDMKKDPQESAKEFEEAQKKAKAVSSEMNATIEEGKKLASSDNKSEESPKENTSEDKKSSNSTQEKPTSEKGYDAIITQTVKALKSKESSGKLLPGEMQKKISYIVKLVTLLVEKGDYDTAVKMYSFADSALHRRVNRKYDKALYNSEYTRIYKKKLKERNTYKIDDDTTIASIKYLASREVFVRSGAKQSLDDMIKYHKVCKFDSANQ